MADDDVEWHPGIKDAGGLKGWWWRFREFGLQGALRLGPPRARKADVRRSVDETARRMVAAFGLAGALEIASEAAHDANFRKHRKASKFFWAVNDHLKMLAESPQDMGAVVEDAGKGWPPRHAKYTLEYAAAHYGGVAAVEAASVIARDWR
jgi:hypothetical protein